jgi:hypothetical protein
VPLIPTPFFKNRKKEADFGFQGDKISGARTRAEPIHGRNPQDICGMRRRKEEAYGNAQCPPQKLRVETESAQSRAGTKPHVSVNDAKRKKEIRFTVLYDIQRYQQRRQPHKACRIEAAPAHSGHPLFHVPFSASLFNDSHLLMFLPRKA